MPKIVQEIYPGNGGLDWDSDKRFMDPNDSEYRLNVIPNEFSSKYVLSNMYGNTKYDHSFTHHTDYGGATYTCIGNAYDDNRDALYFFIYSDLDNHSILRFNFSDKSFEKICFDHTGLGLDIDYPIADAFMIGDWLHFNPRSSSPRAINVQWAYWDFAAYTRSYAAADATTWDINDYVKDRNKVFKILVADITHISSLYNRDNSEVEFVEFTYQDVDTHPGSGTYGEYQRYRDFYNIPEILPYTPGTVIETDTDYEYNNIRGRRFQFCYRLYVPDQGYTISSSFTENIYPSSSETNKGEIEGDIQENNKIQISFPVSSDTGPQQWISWNLLFEFVEILFREGTEDNWKVAERIYQNQLEYDNTRIVSDFFNDRAYETVDNVQIEKQYNALPKNALAQWSLDGERSAYGGVTEGFASIAEMEVTLATGAQALSLDVSDTSAIDYTWTITWDADREKWEWELTDAVDKDHVDVDLGDVLRVRIYGNDYYHTLVAGDITSDTAYAEAMVSLMAQGGITAQVSPGPRILFYSDISDGIVSSISLLGVSTITTLSKKFSSFKNGAWHPFCLYYYDDALRRSEPIFNEDFRVYMETLPEIVPGDSTNYRRYIDWTIAHSPPSWASYWRWGYAGNQTIDRFWQYNVSEVSVQEKDTGTSPDDWTRLDISPLQQLDDQDSGFDHYFPNTVIDAYSFEVGDRVRFITTKIDYPDTYDQLQVAAENRDYEILEYDDINNYIYIDLLEGPTGIGTSTTTPAGADDETYVIEIYRPKKQTGNTVYYEFGPLYSTYLDSGVLYHRGDSQDQTAGDDAEGQFNTGDVWVITRLFSSTAFTNKDSASFVESEGWSDFYDTKGWGKGKAGVFTGIGENYLNNVRYSNRYSPNTQLGGMSTFDPLDYKELSTDHGNIIAMRQAGNQLKVYFERNSAAVLVGKQQMYNADGTSQIIRSDNVLGDAVYSNYHYGTIFPESVILKDRTVLFYDIYRETYLKDSPNGLHPVSDNKMARYFHEKSAVLRSNGVANIQVYSAYDYDYDMVYVHFVDLSDSDNNEVILYHDPSDEWKTFLSINDNIKSIDTTTTTSTSSSSSTTTSTTPAGTMSGLIFGHGSLRLVSFIGEDVYIHNSNETRNNFWGTQYNSIVDFTANVHPNVKKVFEAITIHSNKPWDCNFVSVYADGTHENGMQSKIPEGVFKLREGQYCSSYLRNMKTNSSSANILDLVRGEQLRGYFVNHRIINDDTTETILYKIDVKCGISRI